MSGETGGNFRGAPHSRSWLQEVSGYFLDTLRGVLNRASEKFAVVLDTDAALGDVVFSAIELFVLLVAIFTTFRVGYSAIRGFIDLSKRVVELAVSGFHSAANTLLFLVKAEFVSVPGETGKHAHEDAGRADCFRCQNARRAMAISTLAASVFATFSFYIAINIADLDHTTSIIIAILYGTVIFCFDWSMINMNGHFKEEGRTLLGVAFAVRFLFVFIAAVAAATPVELRIFQEEIQEEVEGRRNANADRARLGQRIRDLETQASGRREALDQARQESAAAQTPSTFTPPPQRAPSGRLEECREMRRLDERLESEECLDESGATIAGCVGGGVGARGPRYRALEREASAQRQRCATARSERNRLIAFDQQAIAAARANHEQGAQQRRRAAAATVEKVEAELAQIEEQLRAARSALDARTDRQARLLEQISALNAIIDGETEYVSIPANSLSTIIGFGVHWVLFILLMLIELAPFFIKLSRALMPGCWETGDPTSCKRARCCKHDRATAALPA